MKTGLILGTVRSSVNSLLDAGKVKPRLFHEHPARFQITNVPHEAKEPVKLPTLRAFRHVDEKLSILKAIGKHLDPRVLPMIDAMIEDYEFIKRTQYDRDPS